MLNALLTKFVTIYGEPKTDDPKAFFAEYAAALKDFNAQTLKLAATNIARLRMISSWPTIAECLDACRRAEGVAKHSSVGLEPIENWDHWYGGIHRDIKYAENDKEIQIAIEKVRPYALAKWCYPHRIDEVEAAGEKRRSELRSKRMTGDAA